MKAKDIVTRNVITVRPDTTIQEVVGILHENRISGVPVVNEDGTVAGMVTEGDLIFKAARPHLPPHIQILGGVIYLGGQQEMQEELRKITAATAQEIMTKHVVTVGEEDEVEDIATLMVQRKINRVPVVESGRISGIITRADILETLVSCREDEELHDVP